MVELVSVWITMKRQNIGVKKSYISVWITIKNCWINTEINVFHYKLQQNDKKHLKKWGICFNFNYNETATVQKLLCPIHWRYNDVYIGDLDIEWFCGESKNTFSYDAGIFKRYECIATNSQLNKNYLRVCWKSLILPIKYAIFSS